VSALEFYQKALAARESALDADRPAIIKLYGLIAGLYRKLGKPEQALEYYDKIQAVSAQLPEED